MEKTEDIMMGAGRLQGNADRCNADVSIQSDAWIYPCLYASDPVCRVHRTREEGRWFTDEYAGWMHMIEGRMVSTVSLIPGDGGIQSMSKAGDLSRTPSLLQTPFSRQTTTPGDYHDDNHSGGGSVSENQDTILRNHTFVEDGGMNAAEQQCQTIEVNEDHDVPATPKLESQNSGSTSTSSEEWAMAFLAPEGPEISNICTSLESGAWTTLQRDTSHLEVYEHVTGNMFVLYPAQADAILLGCFWIEDSRLVMVTSLGFEIHKYGDPSTGGASGFSIVVSQQCSSVQWHKWSHPARLLVLGSGARLRLFQISSTGVQKLPFLDLSPPWGSPIKGKAAARRLAKKQVNILVAYNRVFIAYQDNAEGCIAFYRVYKDAIPLVARYPISTLGDENLDVAVLENCFIIHSQTAGEIRVLDLASSCTFRSLVAQGSAGTKSAGRVEVGTMPDVRHCIECDISLAQILSILTNGNSVVLCSNIQVLQRGFVLDTSTGMVYTIRLGLTNDTPENVRYESILCFLGHRGANIQGKSPEYVAMDIIKHLLSEAYSIELYKIIFLSIFYFQHPLVSPETLAVAILRPHAEIHSDKKWYIQAVLMEMMRACHVLGTYLQCPPEIFELYLDCFGRNEFELLPGRLRAFGHIFDSPYNASILEDRVLDSFQNTIAGSSSGTMVYGEEQQETYLLCAKAMRTRLNDPVGLCRIYLRQGEVIRALRIIQEHGLEGIIDRFSFLEGLGKPHMGDPQRIDDGDLDLIASVYGK